MALETGTYISDLVVTNPTSADPKSQGDDHLRLIKSALKATFPLFTGAVAVTHTALNYIANVTSDIQAQFNTELATRQSADLLRGLIAGQAWAGIHDFTTATIKAATQAVGDSSQNVATTAFVASTSFSTVLPSQAGNTGKFVTTDGTNASWASIPAGASIYTATNFGAF